MPPPGEQVDEGPQPVPPLPDEALEGRLELFKQIFSDCSADVAKKASLAERQASERLDVPSLTYAEVDFEILHDILNTVKREHVSFYANTGVFVDLGSGAGKACVAAGLLHPFQRAVGIEQLQCLNEFAMAAIAKYKDVTLPDGASKPEIELIQGDFVADMVEKLEPIASEISMLLVVATCYGEDQMKAVAMLAKMMPAGSIVVTFTQPLPDSVIGREAGSWALVRSEQKKMMWGSSTCFIFKKVAESAAATEKGAGD